MGAARLLSTKEPSMNVKYSLIALMIAGLSGPAMAQSTDTQSTPRIDKRQENQEKRIEQGTKSGQLNEKETARLEKGQAKVQKMEDKAVADGKVTKKEKKKIEHAQDHQSKKIYKEKHDKQTAK
jgi:hypothetical protein